MNMTLKKVGLLSLSLILVVVLILLSFNFSIDQGKAKLTVTVGDPVNAAGISPDVNGTTSTAVQTALDMVANTGGEVYFVSSSYTFTGTVSRAIDNVVFKLNGATITNDGVTPLFDIGSQKGWSFYDGKLDAGGITLSSGESWTLNNVWFGTTYYSLRTDQTIYAGNVSAPTGRTATYVIAASDATALEKAQADYITDNLDDGIVSTYLQSYRKILFISGSTGFLKTSATGLSLPSNIEVELRGRMYLANSLNIDAYFWKNADQTNGNTNILISGGENAIYDCNRAGQSGGDQYLANFKYVSVSKIDAYIINYTVLEAKTKLSSVDIINHRFMVKPILFDNCESISTWSVPYGTASTDIGTGISGTNCIKMTATNPTATSVRIDKNLPDNIDAEAYIMQLWIKIADTSTVSRFKISGDTPSGLYLSGSFGDFGEYSNFIKIVPNNAWIKLQIPLTYYTSISAGHKTIRLRIDPTPENTVTMWVDDIWLIPSEIQPNLSFVFDDGYETIGESTLQAANIISKYKGASAVGLMGSGYINNPYLSISQLNLLYDHYGWDIFTHGYLHFDTITTNQAILQTNSVINFITGNGFSRGTNLFAFPGHDSTAEDTQLILKMFKAYRNPSQMSIIDNALNRLNYATQAPISGTTYTISTYDKDCMRRHIWMCYYSHYIGTGQMEADWLDNFCSYWYDWGIIIKPPSEVLNNYNQPTVLTEGYIAPGEIRTYSGTIGTLTENAFNSLDNPFGQAVRVLSLDFYISTAANDTTPNSTIDSGLGSSATTDYTTLFEGVDCEATGFYNSVNSATIGKQTVPQLWASGSGNRYLNMSIKDAAATGMVCKYTVTVMGN